MHTIHGQCQLLTASDTLSEIRQFAVSRASFIFRKIFPDAVSSLRRFQSINHFSDKPL